MTESAHPPEDKAPSRHAFEDLAPLRQKTIVLVGLMGVGKSSVGRRLATVLNLPFRDADNEVEAAAGRSISEIFAELGEPAFRDGERRVIARLLDEPPHVLATGGGAFVNAETRAMINDKALSVWLKADVELLARRVSRKDTRPLLKGKDPVAVLTELARVRNPAYAEAQVHVQTGDTPHGVAVDAILAALRERLTPGVPTP
ncbi:shikimate kinase [Caulobacter sp. BP25]|uniref:shikimate kinase n=1 Tax=Caulobacter sp. BP25 TaxID=2048900 RepID=UPI000C12BD5A|nr:shikimate kinase [Caulobacter sp. BP25]PHY20773.1 shikimate kinase [Caulobacter sp. BP25]